jgi:hypothetical protein
LNYENYTIKWLGAYVDGKTRAKQPKLPKKTRHATQHKAQGSRRKVASSIARLTSSNLDLEIKQSYLFYFCK